METSKDETHRYLYKHLSPEDVQMPGFALIILLCSHFSTELQNNLGAFRGWNEIPFEDNCITAY